VETSEQQRRSAVGQFAQTLADKKFDFDAIDIVDMLWLAQFIEPGTIVRAETPAPPKVEASPATIVTASTIDETALNLYPNDSLPRPTTASSSQLAAKPQAQGVPFSVPAAPALRTRIDLARSLRPLMRKVPSRSRFDLDEDATVTRIAETSVWMPVVQARQERWLELDLVVEASKTTVIWERAIAELNHLVEYQGAFRSVRTWRLDAQSGKVELFPRWRDGAVKLGPPPESASNQRSHTPGELIDPSGRRLIWLVTDCISLLWRQDLIYKTILNWAKKQPIAIVQMFPENLWSRTSLRDGHIVRLSALAPELPTAQLAIEGLPQRFEQRSRTDLVTVPIVTLEAGSMSAWARVAAGLGDTRTPGRTFDREFIRKQAGRSPADRAGRSPQQQRTAESRVALFRSTTSRTVQQLANLMAAAPVSLPVIDLLREAFRADFVEEVQQSHVAEVLLSGLLRRCDTAEEAVCRYEFFGDDSSDPIDRVRDILLGDASLSKTVEVLDVLSAAICRKLNSSVKSFEALLGELPTESGDRQDAILPFAKVGLDVLRRLGGKYAELAQRHASLVLGQVVVNDFPLEDLEYEVAKFINFPALQTCEYESATIIAILEHFDLDDRTEFSGTTPSSNPNLSNMNLSSANLSEVNLSQSNLSASILREADLSRSNLSASIFREADLSRSDLSASILREADLSRSNLSEANLYGADLSNANISNADLSRSDLSGVNLRGADLSRSDLSNANISGADLSGSNFSASILRGADLSGSNFSASILRGADLSQSYCSNADLSGADLSNADLSGADLSNADLSGVDLSNADLSRADLSRVDFSGVDLSRVNFSRADLSNADLSGMDLSRVRFSGADLSNADLSNADLSNADLSNADLSNADLSNADLSNADLSNADLSRVDLGNVDLSGADLNGANFSGTDLSDTHVSDDI
jgi:uncharacterized protein YjbI with pentapeptide repeats